MQGYSKRIEHIAELNTLQNLLTGNCRTNIEYASNFSFICEPSRYAILPNGMFC